MPGRQRRRQQQQISVGERVRAKTTGRVGEVTNVEHDGVRDQVTVSYDEQPPARDGAELPRELVDREHER